LGEVKHGTTGYGTVRNLHLNEQYALCKMAYSLEEHVFIDKTFY